MLKSIKSLKNPLIKQILLLQEKSRVRKETGLFVIEGIREIRMAIEGGYEIDKILFGDHMASYFDAEKLVLNLKDKPEIIEISREVHLRICIREGTEPFIALCKYKDHDIKKAELQKDTPLILIAEAPEKPGNIGALLRTADGAGVDMVIIANPRTDLYNPNVIRSSLGCLFSLPVFTGTSAEVIDFCKKSKISVYAASLEASVSVFEIEFEKRCAIVVGAEDIGLSEEWTKNSLQNIIIPMLGKVDSLNVSVSTGILLYEAVRQKLSKGRA